MLFLYPLAGYQLHQHMKDQSLDQDERPRN